MKKRVLSLSIQAIFGGYWDEDSSCFRMPDAAMESEPVKVRYRLPSQSEDTLDFRVFLSPISVGGES